MSTIRDTNPAIDGPALMRWLDEAAQFSEPGPGVTRRFLTHEHRALLNWLTGLAEGLGYLCRVDAAGNLRMRRPGVPAHASTLLFGSHQDTVPHGGKYDGMLGVLLPLAALAALPELPFDVEVVAFGDEEGTRFGTTLVGSGALAGRFDAADLTSRDDAGVSMEEAMREFGLDPRQVTSLALPRQQLLGFVEVHIEQGPVLERAGKPVGVVSGITGIERHQVAIEGRSGHAGTTPMDYRDDALVKAASLVTWVDELCRGTDNLVGVVGKLVVEPNAVNVIPGRVSLTVEFRSPDEGVRRAARDRLDRFLVGIPGASRVLSYSQSGVACDTDLSRVLRSAVVDAGYEPLTLFSGAGHDGLAMAHVTRCAMLFVRCRGGLSHHPDEAITAADCDAAMSALRCFCERLVRGTSTTPERP